MSRFDDWKFKENQRMQDERMRMDMMRDKMRDKMDMMRDKIYPPINDPIKPMNDPIDFGPLDRTLDMQDDFRRPLPEPIDPPRDIRFDPLGPMNVAPGVDMRPIHDMFPKKGVY